ncbi:MAG TPA: STAS/SEC14 domain-containing protein [Porticoccaceae bacterium]|jgi:hypothetical protein|nr:STAS/SEC14 domain-containing protein [Gammaproteobacteria bacterium]HIL59822.1 STAS/SEC14 domain-containing protein [Porticoccaceae bacterium]
MLCVFPNSRDRVNIEFTEMQDAEAMVTALDELFLHSKNIEQGKKLYRIKKLHWQPIDGIMVELSKLPELFKLMRKVDRIAVVTEKE